MNVPIHNQDAEVCLLGSILHKPKLIYSLKTSISQTDFYSDKNGNIWKNINGFISENPTTVLDLVSFASYLRSKGELDNCGGLAYVSDLTTNTVVSNADYYARIVKNCSLKRELSKLANILEEQSNDPTQDITNLLNETHDKLATIQASNIINDNDYLKSNVKEYMDEYFSIVNSETVRYSTGFKKLDNILNGGIKPGLTIIGAVSSLGKTTFCLQIADTIAKQNKDVIFISLEQGKIDLISKSLSRTTAELCLENGSSLRYNTSALSQDEIQESVFRDRYTQKQIDTYDSAYSKYMTYAEHMHIVEPMGRISAKYVRKMVDTHYYYHHNYPVIVIDYLQLLKSEDKYKHDEREVIDDNMTLLRQIARDYNTPVIAISSIGREEGKKGVGINSFKGSGGIEYGADVGIGMQFKGTGESGYDEKKARSQQDFKDIELFVVKNRRCSPSDDPIRYLFYAKYNIFVEADDPEF